MSISRIEMDIQTFSLIHQLVWYSRQDTLEEVVQFLTEPSTMTGELLFDVNKNMEFSYRNTTTLSLGKNLNKLFKLLSIRNVDDLYNAIQLYYLYLPVMEPDRTYFSPVKVNNGNVTRYSTDQLPTPRKITPRRISKMKSILNPNINSYIQRMSYMKKQSLMTSQIKKAVIKTVYKYIVAGYKYVIIGIVDRRNDFDDVRLCHDRLKYYTATKLVAEHYNSYPDGVYFLDDVTHALKYVENGQKKYYIVNNR